MTSILQFTKQNLLLALEKAKKNTTLSYSLFEQKTENQAVDFYEVTQSYLESLENDASYTFEQLIPPLLTEGKNWYTWYRKTLIWTFLAQNSLTESLPTTTIEGDFFLKKSMLVAGNLEIKGNLYLADNGEAQAELIVLGSLICRKKIEKTTWAGTHIICGRNLEAKSIVLYSNYLGVGENLKSKAVFMDTNDNTVQVLGNVTSKIWFDEDIASDSFLAGKLNITAFRSDSLEILYKKPENGVMSHFLPLFREKFLNHYRFIDCSFDDKEEIYENPNAPADIEETVEFKDFLADAVANYTKALK